MPVEKGRLGFERFLRFREIEPVPKGMRQGVENHQAGVHAGPQQGAMEIESAAEAVVAGGRHAKGGREAVEVGVHRRVNRVLAVVVSHQLAANRLIDRR
jgi:hypothetical protein